MNELMTIVTPRELFLISLGTTIYIVLFIVTVQNSKRKILSLQERLDKVRAMQEHFRLQRDVQRNQQLLGRNIVVGQHQTVI